MVAWRPARSPQSAAGDPPRVVTVDDAVLTRFQTGRLRTTERTDRWIRGAVHDADLRLVPESQRVKGDTAGRVVAADPRTVPAPGSQVERVAGTWLYAGHWMDVFGHFVLETLTNLWPEPQSGADGILCHRWYPPRPEVEAWQRDLVDRAGYADTPIRFADLATLRVERLVVPERPVVVGGWAHEAAVATWRRVAVPLVRPGSPERVYLSRTAFNATAAHSRSTPERDAALDRDFAGAGFEVVTPEALPLHEQVSLVAGARVIAGAAGSGLHLTAFAAAPAYVIEVGDSRSPGKRLNNQRVIDAACGHRAAFVPARTEAREVLEQLDWDVTRR